MKFVLASHNRKKLAEMQEILRELGVEVVLQSDVGLDLEPEENGVTFAENAAIKAMAVMQASGLPAIADDSGLCVDALNGAPGIYSARYGGVDSDQARYRLLLENLRGAGARTAHFHTAIVCCFPNGDRLDAAGAQVLDALCRRGRPYARALRLPTRVRHHYATGFCKTANCGFVSEKTGRAAAPRMDVSLPVAAIMIRGRRRSSAGSTGG